MFPIRDHNPSRHTPVITFALIAVNVVVFALYWPLFSDPRALQQFFLTWGLVPRFSVPETFVTSMFLHGGVMHLAGNMLFLWVFGDNLEDEMGRAGFLGFYLAGGLAAAALQVVSDPASTVPVVGASGAIAGVMGGYLLMYPKARVDILVFLVIIIRVIPVPAWLMLGVWFALQLVNGVGAGTEAGGVAYWAHAGGFVAGVVLALPLWLRRGGPGFWARTDGHPPHPEGQYRMVRTSIPRVPRK